MILIVSKVVSPHLLPFIFVINKLINHINIYTLTAFTTHVIYIHVSYFVVKVLGALVDTYNIAATLLQIIVTNLASQLNSGLNRVIHLVVNNDACTHKYGKLVILLILILLFFVLESRKTIFFYKTPIVKTIQTPTPLSILLTYTIVITTTTTSTITGKIKLFFRSYKQ
jgi:hypothetical protein